VPARSGWELTPRQSVEMECARRGEPAVVVGCVALLSGQDVDDGLLFALGDPMASIVIHDGPLRRNQYWRRVWAARSLLYAWMPEATDATIAGLCDEHWRVREMAAKVVEKRKIGDALREVATLRQVPCREFEPRPSARSSC